MTGEPRRSGRPTADGRPGVASGQRPAAGGRRAAGGSGRAAGGGSWLAETLRRRPLLADTLLALAVYAVGALLWLTGPPELWPRSSPAALVWSAVGMASVVVRRRWLWPACVLLSVHALVPLAFEQLGSEELALLVLTYTAAARLPARQAVLATLLMWVPLLTAAVLLASVARGRSGVASGYLVTFNALVALVCFLVGRTVRNQRAYAAALRLRARTAEEHLRSRAEQAVAEERRRIARELHDVVAHHVSVMGVLATGARRVLRRDPDAADEALTTIEETGRTTLRELRRLLSVLRTEAEPAAELAPQPGLGAITALAEQVREAGLPVTLRIQGDPGPLDPGVALTVYRIVQEALTNTLKHAGAATAEVRLGVADGRLTLEVCDTGHGPRPDGQQVGHGLLGMRERVALYGGTLRTGPRPGGGFRVTATIPADQLDSAAAGG
ncbi:MAG TPA: sensor histidine kinase [Micromonosporaceae bacterium]|nr:sensor histidine kinase [Micromonosporaceae bacterium]